MSLTVILFLVVIGLHILNTLLYIPLKKSIKMDAEILHEMSTILIPTLEELRRFMPEKEEMIEVAIIECKWLEERSERLQRVIAINPLSRKIGKKR